MFLIDKPFASDFLINTLKDNGYPVVSTSEARALIKTDAVNWISEKEAVTIIKENPDTTLYTNSENTIVWVLNNLKSSQHARQIQLFKDKSKFRELVKDIYPNFFFKTVSLEAIQKLELKESDYPFVIKPALGFFSLGVHIVHNTTDWQTAKKELNFKNLQSIYPKEVLDISTFIIEEYIEGEEYAVDCYFNDKGEVVILNILHHKFSSGTDVSDRVYSTSQAIIEEFKKPIEDFLRPIGRKANLKNFPLHVEIRIDANGKIQPIEINAMRFGGWCTTGDLSWHAFGINSYTYFIEQKKPNWIEIFKNKAPKIYSIVVLNNSSGIKRSEITGFDYNLLDSDFENIMVLRKLDINTYPVFGFMFTETSPDNTAELDKILVSDLKKYINT